MINQVLFEGQRVFLAPIDPEKDAEIEAKWTGDTRYTRMLELDPVLPMSAAQVKKKYEALEKQMEENRSTFYFAVRTRTDDRLIGFAHLPYIEWNHGVGWVKLGIGSAEDRGLGYGTEILRLVLAYSFNELNLFKLAATIAEYNTGGIRLFEQAGFRREVCRRQAVERNGRYWDVYLYGLLRKEWEEK